MTDDQKAFGLALFGPISLEWNAERQELDLCGTTMAGLQSLPFRIQMDREAAIQTLRAFRNLLDRVDEESVAATMPSGLQ